VSQNRNVYTVLEWLRDIGGLFSILTSIAGALVSMVAGKIFKIMLLSTIFKQRDYQDQ